MKYFTKLKILESKGINYHRVVADFILDHLCSIYKPNTASILVYGDKDLLISYLLAHKYRIHVNNIGIEEPEYSHKVQKVELDTFPLCEYDVIIGLFCDKEFIKNCISSNNNFFIIPQPRSDYDANIFTREFLKSQNIKFTEIEFDAYMSNQTAFFNFSNNKS